MLDDGDTGRVHREGIGVPHGPATGVGRRGPTRATGRTETSPSRSCRPCRSCSATGPSRRSGASFCAALNDAVAAMVAVAPLRFGGFGAVPLQDVGLAIDALAQVRRSGCSACRSARTWTGVSSGSPRFLPFFQAAADLGLAVFVHAFHPPHWELRARRADGGGGQLSARDRHRAWPRSWPTASSSRALGCASARATAAARCRCTCPACGRSGVGRPGAGRRAASPDEAARVAVVRLPHLRAGRAARTDRSRRSRPSHRRLGLPVLRRTARLRRRRRRAATPATDPTRSAVANAARVPRAMHAGARELNGAQHDRATDVRRRRRADDDLGRRPRRRAARRVDEPAAREVRRGLPAHRRGGRQGRVGVRGTAQGARRARRPAVPTRDRQARPRRLPGAVRGAPARVLRADGTGPRPRRRRHRGVGVLPVVPAVLRPGVRRGAGQGAVAAVRAGVQRLDDRRLVRGRARPPRSR